jgi:hypothetical protein
MQCAEIPERATNSACEGARPSLLAVLATASMMRFFSDTLPSATLICRRFIN